MLKTFISDFTENTYLITEQKETIIIDPGVKFKELSDYVEGIIKKPIDEKFNK